MLVEESSFTVFYVDASKITCGFSVYVSDDRPFGD